MRGMGKGENTPQGEEWGWTWGAFWMARTGSWRVLPAPAPLTFLSPYNLLPILK